MGSEPLVVSFGPLEAVVCGPSTGPGPAERQLWASTDLVIASPLGLADLTTGAAGGSTCPNV